MTTASLLKKLVAERRAAINRTRYVSVRTAEPFVRRAYADHQRAQRIVARATRELRAAGFDVDGAQPGQLREANVVRLKEHTKLSVAHERAAIDMLKATTGPQRAAVIERFIADTKDLIK